ncbi:hypothetical protein OHA37_38955 [Streptomyces sp. NBC_00335]|uniref:hypothetical protein n=1 Tax=unclassified Streptomyces TaxID=2593676 RepID=UPI00225AE340|nr:MULTISPECIES: hypothetical protein [unclassified Streptomyces]MCX5409814.1 hypothetical protein [Streptomyces sp. NBC_00086]
MYRHRLLTEAIEYHRAVDQHKAREERAAFAALPFETVVDLVSQGLDAEGEHNRHLVPYLMTAAWQTAFRQYNERMTHPEKVELLADVTGFRKVYGILWEA